MATPPDFTAGSVLTAAQMNSVGRWKVAAGTFTNAASFDVTGFVADYDFYQLNIFYRGHAAASAVTGVLYSGTTPRNTAYYGAAFRTRFDGTTGSTLTRNNAADFPIGTAANTVSNMLTATIHGIGTGEFNIVWQLMDNNNVDAVFGGYSNYAATNSFDIIRFSGSANIAGYWNLAGVRQ